MEVGDERYEFSGKAVGLRAEIDAIVAEIEG
jgi:hypothetical protein